MPLTKAQAYKIFGSRLNQPRVTPSRVIMMQIILTLLVTIIALFLTKSTTMALSIFLGGLVCWFPGTLFVMFLHFKQQVVFHFVVAEILKIFATILLLLLVAALYHSVNWLALLVMYIITLKIYWLAWIVW